MLDINAEAPKESESILDNVGALKASDVYNPNKPMTLDEFIADKTPEQRQLITQTLDVYENYKSYTFKNCCAYCSNELTVREIETLSPQHFTNTCTEHRPFAIFWNVDMIKDMLARGEDPILDMRKYIVSDKPCTL